MQLRKASTILLFGLLLGGALVLATACSHSRQPTNSFAHAEEARRTLLAQIEAIAGSDALSCGLTLLGEDLSTATSCVVAALANGQDFWVASELQGDDSELWRVVVRNGGGTFKSQTFDSSVDGRGRLLEGQRYEIYGGTASCSRLSLPSAQRRYIDCE
jgi:hypothetical protein